VSLNKFTSTALLPTKVLRKHPIDKNNHIIPYHIQLYPTHKCNRNCHYCVLSKLDRTVEMHFDEICALLRHFWFLGTRAVTLTGGGEPTLHPKFWEIVAFCYNEGIETGLVTNGDFLHNAPNIAHTLTWIRMSVNDITKVPKAIESLINIDVGLSLVITDRTPLCQVEALCELANAYKHVTHVRFAQDVVHLPKTIFEEAKKVAAGLTDKAVFQNRDSPTVGTRQCLVGQLRPLITANGDVYPCCGIQYSTRWQGKYPAKYKYCHWTDYELGMKAFDGSICERCDFMNYNTLLQAMTEPVEHEEFI